MTSRFSSGSCELAYRTFGSGERAIIAFHGFGRTGQDLAVFERALGNRFTIYAFDLPFHGDSPSPSERAQRPFEPHELRDFFTSFADSIGAARVVVLGYSLGGRVALSLLETMPERIAQAILLAPDGLKTKPWYRRLASSAWGRARYVHFIDHPQRVHAIINTLHTMGVLNDKLHRFIRGQSDTREKRSLLHDVWLSFRHIEPDLHLVACNARAHHIPIDLVFGAKDSVIRPALAARLAPEAAEHIRTTVIDAGHQLLTTELGDRLKGLLARSGPQ